MEKFPLEQHRAAHELIDRLEDAVAKELQRGSLKTHKSRLAAEHRVLGHVRQIAQTAKHLQALYSKDSALQNDAGLKDPLGEFDRAQSELEKTHAARGDAGDVVERPNVQLAHTPEALEQAEAALAAQFSGEEAFGRFVDLNEAYGLYCNLGAVELVSYVRYLETVREIDAVAEATRRSAAFGEYLDALQTYLVGFLRRSRPLWDVDAHVAQWRGECEAELASESENIEKQAALYCAACRKAFSNANVFEAHGRGKKHVRAAEALARQRGSLTANDLVSLAREHVAEKTARARARAVQIAVTQQLLETLTPVLEDTRANVERKQSLTERERLLEQDDTASLSASEPDEQDERVYNPLKLPLGWDGKPIPFWLYKLHGLGIEFPCEICGNYVYRGRQAFDRHFAEARHMRGLQCLGITGAGRQFHDVTAIADAQTMWRKLQQTAASGRFNADTMEECEDADGNVFNRKTYLDLKRQGLL